MKMLIIMLSFWVMWAQAQTLRVGVVPQFSTLETAKTWTPLVTALQKTTGIELELVHYPDIPAFEKAFKAGDADVIYMNPYHAVMAFETQGYVPIIRDEKLLSGILVVRHDSGISRIEDLMNKKIVFPAPNAFGAALWIRAQLIQKYHLSFEPVYVGTHQNVYRQVDIGDAIAGGGVMATLNKESAATRDHLKVIYTTPGASPHPLAVHPRVDAKVAQLLQTSLIDLAKTEEGKKLLAAVQLPNPMLANYEKDYLPLKALNLESYVQ